MSECTCSLLASLIGNGKKVELVVDNARSHSSSTVTTIDSSDTVSAISIRESEFPTSLVSVPNDYSIERLHHSFPPRGRAPNDYEDESLILGAWMSSSDSDLTYITPSFDEMLRERSSGTTSAMSNVSRPVRRGSLTEA